jgi:hypothetical protein
VLIGERPRKWIVSHVRYVRFFLPGPKSGQEVAKNAILPKTGRLIRLI